MTYNELRTLYEDLLTEVTTKILDTKHREYANKIDVLINFKKAAELAQIEPEQVNWGYALKHFVSILDLLQSEFSFLNDNAIYESKLSLELVREKITDMIGYLVLLYALFAERTSRNN